MVRSGPVQDGVWKFYAWLCTHHLCQQWMLTLLPAILRERGELRLQAGGSV